MISDSVVLLPDLTRKEVKILSHSLQSSLWVIRQQLISLHGDALQASDRNAVAASNINDAVAMLLSVIER